MRQEKLRIPDADLKAWTINLPEQIDVSRCVAHTTPAWTGKRYYKAEILSLQIP